MHSMLGVTADVLAPPPPPDHGGRAGSRELADRVVEAAGWRLRPGTPDRENLAAALERFEQLNGHALPLDVAPYAETADRIARHEIAALDPSAGRGQLLAQMVVGQVLFGHRLAILRRLAEEQHSGERFGRPEE